MKLSKTSALLLSIGFVIIVLASLGVVRSQQVKEQNRLDEELTALQVKPNGFQLEQLTNQKETLEKRLRDIIVEAEKSKSVLNQVKISLDTTAMLFSTAETTAVKILNIASSGPTNETVSGINFSVLPLQLRVEGNLAELINFATAVNDSISTGVIRSVKISIPEPDSGTQPTADIHLAIYSY